MDSFGPQRFLPVPVRFLPGSASKLNFIYRFMYLATTLRAWRDHTSLMGLLPW